MKNPALEEADALMALSKPELVARFGSMRAANKHILGRLEVARAIEDARTELIAEFKGNAKERVRALVLEVLRERNSGAPDEVHA